MSCKGYDDTVPFNELDIICQIQLLCSNMRFYYSMVDGIVPNGAGMLWLSPMGLEWYG